MGRIFYSAQGARTGDVIPKYIDGTYQLFYLKGWKNPKDPNVIHGWHRMETDNLVDISEETPIHVKGGTGDLIYAFGKWHLFACIFPDGKQFVTHYISEDGSLDHWNYMEEDTFGPDGEIYDLSDWRDPRIFYREDLDEYWMILAARAKAAHTQNGCVGLCVSKDLKKWEYREPFYYPQRFNGACECPDIFKMGDWYYLIFSSYTNLFGNYYMKCKVGSTEWEIPKNHRLDSRAFYAAKTAGHGNERYLFGWNPTKEENIFGFWPDRLQAIDYRTWDWGGDMVIHQLLQQEDGDLALAPVVSKIALFDKTIANTFQPITEGWLKKEQEFYSESGNAQQMMLMQPLPENYYISAWIQTKDAEQAGLILQVNEEMKEGYYLYLEPENKRLVYRSWLRMSEDGGKTFPWDVEMEVPVRITEDSKYHFEILAEGTTAVIYVNKEAAMSFRMCDLKGRNLGFFALGKAGFSKITLKTIDE